jgi:hypothetical protein
MGMFDKPGVAVTINLFVHDVRTFVRAARIRAIAEGVDPEDARKTYRATNLGACAGMLIDPGTSPPGSEITDTSTEVF